MNHSPASLDGESFSFGAKPGFVQHLPSDAHIVVPDAHLLFSGNYTRIGSDLIISDGDQKFVVGSYFKGEARPALMSKDGAMLSAQIVEALTGHVHYAQASAPTAAAQVIGHVLKMSGSATAIRNGVSVELHIGDAVQKGDVIQTASDSSIGMTFVDGSAFGMTSNARMVLNEMIYDPNGSSNSSLISLVQGTITFVAGQTAKNGNMRVDTPVATMGIRGTAVLVEIGADNGPTKFSVLVEPDGHTGSYNLYDKTSGQLIGTVSQAGQVTFVSVGGIGQPPSAIEQLKTLQDQQQEKALIQQVFQLYFPNYNPDNSNPKTQKFGSSSYNNLAEITFTTTNFNQQTFLTQIELRIGVTDPLTGVTTYHNRTFYNTKAVFSADSVFGDQAFVPVTETFKFQDVVHIDDPDIGNAPFYDVGVPFVAGSALIKSAESTISNVSEAFLKSLIHINQTTGQVSFDRQQFNFLDDGQTVTIKIQVTATSGPDTGYVIVPITITGANDAPTIVVGAATVTEAGVKEDVAVASGHIATDGTITFQDFDLTDAHTASVALTSTTSNLPGFTNNTTNIGTFTIDAVSENLTDTDNHGSVGWHFTLDDSDPTLQSLAEGQTIKQTYTITIKDDNGVPVTQTVTITITGTNDVPVLTADSTVHNTIEIPDTTGDSTLDVSTGSLTFTDVDLSDTHLAAAALHPGTTSVTWSGGTYLGIPQLTRDALATAMTASVTENNSDTSNQGTVNWKFQLPDNLLDFLADGETLTIVYDVTVTDNNGASSTKQVTVQIGAANDQPVISVIDATAAVTEDFSPVAGFLKDTGSVTFTDADLTDTHQAHVVYNNNASGAFVSANLATALATALTVPTTALAAGDHDFDWNFALDNSLVQYLAVGETITATYTITVTDNSGADNDTSVLKTVTVTITGTNDGPTITSSSAAAAGTFNEISGAVGSTVQDQAGGTITFGDVDLTDTHQATQGALNFVWSGGTLSGPQIAALTSASARTLTPHDSTGSGSGSADWTYKITDGALDFLAKDESLTVTYTITVADFHGASANGTSATQQITVIITGTNDDAVISVASGDHDTGGVSEDAHVGTETATGTLSFSDVDLTDTHTITAAPVGTTLGTLTAIKSADTSGGTGGSLTWTYNVADSAIQYLAAGQQKDEKFTVSVFDGTSTVTKEVTVTITGTNDNAIISVASGDHDTGDVIEDAHVGTETATGTLSFSDVDLADTHTISAAPVGTTLGTLTATKTADTSGGTGGSLTWNYNVADSAIQYLAAGEIRTETFKVSVFDGTSTVTKDVVVTIHGANDDAVITVAALDHDTGDVIEDAHVGTETATGTLSFGDADLTDTHTITAAPVGTTIGTLTAIKSADTSGGTGGSLTWNYSVADSAIQHLGVNDTVTETFKVSVFDGTSTVIQDVVVTIHGTNDAPVVSGAVTATVAEDSGPSTLDALANATDADDGHVLSVVNLPGTLPAGVTYDTVHHTFTLDPTDAAYQHLGVGDSMVVTVNYGVSDGIVTTPTAASMSWTVTGTNDAPVMNVDNVSTEDLGGGVTKVSGVSLSDIDSGTDNFTVKAVADHGTVATSDGDPLADGITGTFAEVTDIFNHGAVYTPQNISATDQVTLTVTDSHGGTDTVNFIFKQFAPGGVTLNGTDGKDWILSSTGDDVITGGAGADNFVFASHSGNDTITDFHSGSDHIVLNDYGTPFTEATFTTWLAGQVDDTANGAVIHLGANDSITLTGVTKASLTAHDFILHPGSVGA